MATEEYDYYGEEEVNATENSTGWYLEDNAVCPPSTLPHQTIIIPSLYFLIFFIGFVGNLFVIIVMANKHKSRRLVDTFVINLAVADLVFVCTLPFWAVSAVMDNRWDFGDFLCKMSSYVIAVNRYSNIFFLTCMSVDRYMAVVRMLDSRFLRSNQCVRLTCGIIWVASFFLGIPSLIYRSTMKYESSHLCVEATQSKFFNGISLISLFLTFVLPVVIIVFCYCSILAKLRHPSALKTTKPDPRRRHSIKIVFTIILAFLVSWLPFNVFKSIHIALSLASSDLLRPQADFSCATQTVLTQGLTLSSCLAFLNSCANPAIYIFLDRHFRHRSLHLCFGWLDPQAKHRRRTVASSSMETWDSSSGSSFTRSRLSSIHIQ
ncbi:probable G-protein coupled receptor 25 [Amia ocellicauda]|uniref:probable G-protein coupled receptor 25 n=1 Tax=Amia ocellicauda TaxID=2972642 RepID=UPI0034639B96